MPKLVRYTTSPDCPSTAPDHNPAVLHGDFENLPKSARLLPPCSPTKIVCVGRNYAEHAKELGNEVPVRAAHFFEAAILPDRPRRVDRLSGDLAERSF